MLLRGKLLRKNGLRRNAENSLASFSMNNLTLRFFLTTETQELLVDVPLYWLFFGWRHEDTGFWSFPWYSSCDEPQIRRTGGLA